MNRNPYIGLTKPCVPMTSDLVLPLACAAPAEFALIVHGLMHSLRLLMCLTGNTNDIDTFRKYIEGLPLIDNPEVFGLHTNADLAYRTMQTHLVLETILDVQPKESGGGGGLTREEIVLRQADDLQVSPLRAHTCACLAPGLHAGPKAHLLPKHVPMTHRSWLRSGQASSRLQARQC